VAIKHLQKSAGGGKFDRPNTEEELEEAREHGGGGRRGGSAACTPC
jgi:hypothetical protein